MPETNNGDHVAAKNDEQESELVKTCTQDRGVERLFYSIGVDSRRTKSERETKDEKNC